MLLQSSRDNGDGLSIGSQTFLSPLVVDVSDKHFEHVGNDSLEILLVFC